jgi:hypothetical protein
MELPDFAEWLMTPTVMDRGGRFFQPAERRVFCWSVQQGRMRDRAFSPHTNAPPNNSSDLAFSVDRRSQRMPRREQISTGSGLRGMLKHLERLGGCYGGERTSWRTLMDHSAVGRRTGADG